MGSLKGGRNPVHSGVLRKSDSPRLPPGNDHSCTDQYCCCNPLHLPECTGIPAYAEHGGHLPETAPGRHPGFRQRPEYWLSAVLPDNDKRGTVAASKYWLQRQRDKFPVMTD